MNSNTVKIMETVSLFNSVGLLFFISYFLPLLIVTAVEILF